MYFIACQSYPKYMSIEWIEVLRHRYLYIYLCTFTCRFIIVMKRRRRRRPSSFQRSSRHIVTSRVMLSKFRVDSRIGTSMESYPPSTLLTQIDCQIKEKDVGFFFHVGKIRKERGSRAYLLKSSKRWSLIYVSGSIIAICRVGNLRQTWKKNEWIDKLEREFAF